MKKIIQKLIRKVLGLPAVLTLDTLKARGLKVGKNFKMLENCIIDESHCWHIEIGDDVTLAPRVHILAHDASTKMHLNYTKVKNVKIGNKVFIGAGSIILPGVTIGNNVIIGAGSIVSSGISENTVVAGNPAKFICTTESFLSRTKSKMNAENCFSEDFTLRRNIDEEKKKQMRHIAESDGIVFVI